MLFFCLGIVSDEYKYIQEMMRDGRNFYIEYMNGKNCKINLC